MRALSIPTTNNQLMSHAPELPCYVEILRRELMRRQGRNPRYSMRSYARFLGMDASSLSRILKGKQQLSITLCQRVIARLALPDGERDRFVESLADSSRRRVIRAIAGTQGSGVVAERERRPRDEDFARLFASAPEALLVLSPDRRLILEANSRACGLFGFDRAQMIGRKLPEDPKVRLEVSDASVDFRGEAAVVAIARPS